MSTTFERFLEDVIRACATCGEVVSMPRITLRCGKCEELEETARKPEEAKVQITTLHEGWRRQGIPPRFWAYELQPQHQGAIKRATVIYGEVGTGKSCLGAQVMKKTGGRFITAAAMLDDIQENNVRIWHYKEMRSLCIDDIQKINPTDFRLEKFFEIFNHRYSEDKHTVVTTDTKPEDLKAKYGKIGEAIVSRIGEWCLKIEMQEKFR